jgi:hypothetical protein
MPTAKEASKTFTPVPAGSHIGRAIHVIALGTQPAQAQFLPTFKVLIGWEIPDEVIIKSDTKEEMPMIISKEYSLSLGKKANLRRDLEGWRGREFTGDELKGFQVENVLDKPCLLNVIHKTSAGGNVYAVISGISPLPKGVTCKPRVHELVQFEVEQGKSCEAWGKIPQFIQKKIEQCEEWLHPAAQEPEPQNATVQEENSDIPF